MSNGSPESGKVEGSVEEDDEDHHQVGGGSAGVRIFL